MGFTFSHPALVIPFKYLPKRFYSTTGLVIGSMIPDFEYFIRNDSDSDISHTLPGIVLFDLPFSFLLALTFHLVIRKRLIANLPLFFRSRFSTYASFDWLQYLKKHWPVVTYSMLVGIGTHLLWDSFTSYNGYFVDRIPGFLSELSLLGQKFYAYKCIKHLSSSMGGLILIYLLLKMKRDAVENEEKDKNKAFWLLFSVIFMHVMCLFIVSSHKHFSYNRIAKTSISSGLAALFTTCIFFHRKTTDVSIYKEGDKEN
jgi:hypothetical protein